MTLDSILPSLTERVTKATAIGKTLKIDFGTKQLYIDGTGTQNVLSNDNRDADCVVVVSEENFVSLATGNLNPMTAVMSGKIKIKGDMGIAMKLTSLFG